MAFATNLNIITALLLVCVSLAFSMCSLKFNDCGSTTTGKLHSLQINETCHLGKEAILKKGSFVQINFMFSASAEETVLTSKVYGALSDLPIFVPFPLKNSDACKNSGLTCPVKANTMSHFFSSLAINSHYPAVKVLVKWELLDKSGNQVFCALLNAQLVD